MSKGKGGHSPTRAMLKATFLFAVLGERITKNDHIKYFLALVACYICAIQQRTFSNSRRLPLRRIGKGHT
jgi:hypothetical protein